MGRRVGLSTVRRRHPWLQYGDTGIEATQVKDLRRMSLESRFKRDGLAATALGCKRSCVSGDLLICYPSMIGCVPNVRRLRHRCKHIPPITRRRGIPVIRNVHDRGHGSAMGRHTTWMLCICFGTFANRLLLEGCENQGAEYVCANILHRQPGE